MHVPFLGADGSHLRVYNALVVRWELYKVYIHTYTYTYTSILYRERERGRELCITMFLLPSLGADGSHMRVYNALVVR